MSKDATGWRVTNHVCRLCFSTILTKWVSIGSRGAGGVDLFGGTVAERSRQKVQVVRCANCSAHGEGDETMLCTCGAVLQNGESAGLRCRLHPEPKAGEPAVVAVYVAEVQER